MATQPDFSPNDKTPPPWLLPVLGLAIIGVAVVIAFLLTQPPAPQAATSVPLTSAPEVAAPSGAQAELPAEHGAADPNAELPAAHGAVDPNGPPVEQIDLAGARARYDDQTAIFIDVRSGEAFKAGHIAGALSITSTDLEARLSALPPDTTLIAYGDATKPDSAVRAAQIFMGLGSPTMLALEGGWQGWQRAGFPTEP